MNINLETGEKCVGTLRVEIPSETVSSERERVTRLFSQHASVPGFRKGKVPKEVVEKRFKTEISGELTKNLIDKAVQESARKYRDEIIDFKKINKAEENVDLTFSLEAEVTLQPKFDLPEYKGIPVRVPKVEVDDDDVDESLDKLRQRFAEYDDADEETELEMGHFAVVDFKGTKDGTPLSETYEDSNYFAERSDFWTRMDEETFLPGFCGELIGLKAGESAKFDLTLPEEFPIEDLKGQDVHYEVKVKEIKKERLPELDDAFAARLGEDFTAEKLREEIKANMLKEMEDKADEMKTNQIISFLNDELEFELPDDVVKQETQRYVDGIVEENHRRGITEDTLVENQAAIFSSATKQAEMSVKSSFILSQVAEKESIKVEADEILGVVKGFAAQEKTSEKKLLAQMRKDGRLGGLSERLLLSKALDFLKENATVEEVDASELEAEMDASA